MKIIDVTFPHPVLGKGDDFSPAPGLEYELKTDKINYTVDIVLHQPNADLDKYVTQGLAEYVCEIECPATFYRNCATSSAKSFHLVIPRNSVRKTIKIQCTARAIQTIEHYQMEGMHEDYEGFEFALTMGDLMAFFGEFPLEADIEYDKLKSVSSMMTIVAADVERPDFNLNNEKIQIRLPREMYDEYVTCGNKKAYVSMIHASLVINALTYALYNIDEDDYAEKLWVKTIKWRLENEEELIRLNINPFESNEGIPTLAQTMLGEPYQRLFKGISMIDESLNEEEE